MIRREVRSGGRRRSGGPGVRHAGGVTDADAARWLRACLWPGQPERVARLEAEMALAATAPPLLLQGDAVEVLPDAFGPRDLEDAPR